MANALLTPTAVTRQALMVLHQKLNFVGKVNRQYDDSFAREGAKIGTTLKIRLPNEYVVRTGATLATQDTNEQSVDLTVATQKGVDLNFTSVDLTMSLDDFSDRIIEPAMAVLAANIEADAMEMYKDVYNQVANTGSAMTSTDALNMSKTLTDNLAPTGAGRCLNLDTQANVDLVDALKGLFNPNANISANYRDGMVANQFLGFREVYENTLWPRHTTGDAAGFLVNGADQTGSTITVDTGTGSFNVGDVITITGVNRVHPETKADTGQLQQFVVEASTASSITVSPEIVISGGRQNVVAAPADNAPITHQVTADTTSNINMGFYRDAFAFATADLIMPDGVDWKSRQVYDGISMRIVRQYDINNDKFPCRLDVLYGYKAIRPQLACRGAFN